MQILLIEADDLLKEKLVNFFNKQHYEIIALGDGQKAIELFNGYLAKIEDPKKIIDIIVCDVDAPTANGMDFINFLQKSKIHIPFIFLTIPDNVDNIVNQLHRGAWNYFQKPLLNLNILLLSIEQLCHREQLLQATTIYSDHVEQNFKDLEEDHLSGSKLQQHLLPKNNIDILSLNFNYFLHPSLYISGDFIDYQQLTDRYVIFYLSDVSGHGVSSGFVNVLLKACVQQYCSEFIHLNNMTVINPDRMLATVNKVICSENLGKYLTMAYMVYDKKLSKLTYSVAGHYPFPILVEQGGTARYIGERGYPIGMVPTATFTNYEIDLPKKFKIAIFSDGIMEFRKEKDLIEKEQAILGILSLDDYNNDLSILKNNLNINLAGVLPDDITGLIVRSYD